jgi:ATP-binding cassette subfamily G (WHITE) protein 2 (SNQ2)
LHEFKFDDRILTFPSSDDIHFPTLTVHQTLSFAAASRTPSETRRIDAEGQQLSRSQYTQAFVDILATILGLKHTFNTKVGNDVIRGVSGGERKRVTVAETLAARAKVALFDNSSRGLDSSTALEFVHSLRIGADILKVSVAASIYQAGESLTDLFDKVLVIHDGQQIYYGRLTEAVSYFERLGFKRTPRQTTADFLVACSSGEPAATQLSEDFANIPITSQDQRQAWLASKEAAELRILVDGRLNSLQSSEDDSKVGIAKEMAQARKQDKAKHTRTSSIYTISITMQVRQAIRRRYQIAVGDPSTLIVTAAVSIFQALIIGSVFVQLPANTSAYFSRGGVLFTALLFNSLQSMSEITKGYAQKPIISRHRRLAFIHPAADAFADTLLDLPIRLFSLIPFIIILYFMAGLAVFADQFFVFCGILVLTSFVLAAFFRMLAAIFKEQSAATMVAGIAVIDMVLYTGYAIPRPSMVIWWKVST